MKIRISPEAEQDLIEIFDYILADNPVAADKTLDVIYSEIHHLSEHPKLGRVGRVRFSFPPGSAPIQNLLFTTITLRYSHESACRIELSVIIIRMQL